MILKLFRHISISLILAVLITLLLFNVTITAGYIFSPYFIFAGAALGIGAFLTPELPFGIKNLISILILALIYYCIHFLIYLDLETIQASIVSEKSILERGWHYISHLSYKDLVSFWPIFTSKVILIDLLFLVSGIEALMYLGYKRDSSRDSNDGNSSEKSSIKTGDTILNKRRVRSKRFKRKF